MLGRRAPGAVIVLTNNSGAASDLRDAVAALYLTP
jgi:hypothetical protein